MNIKSFQSEKGQALYLIAIALVGLIGVAALSIDGGRIYSDRRHAQNAADTSSYAGALTIAQLGAISASPMTISTGPAVSNAIARATSNGYTTDADTTVTATVSGPHTDAGVYYLVTVTIVDRIDTTFAHLVFTGPLRSTVTSTVRVRPPQNITFGFSVYGASPNSCETIFFSGSSNTTINGGGVYSNSDQDSGGGGGCDSGANSGSGDVNVTTGGISSVGGWDSGGSGSITPAPTTGATQKDLPPYPVPDCTGLVNRGDAVYNGGVVLLEPGIYGEIRFTGNPVVTMNPGMYCITGSGGFTGTGGTITGLNVMIYLEDGPFNLGGNTLVNLTAPTNLVDASGTQWAGMLIYMNYFNDEQVVITGTGLTAYTGTVFAPGPTQSANQPKCEVTGSGGSLGLNSQLICYTVKISGSSEVLLNFDQSQNFKIPGALELEQ